MDEAEAKLGPIRPDDTQEWGLESSTYDSTAAWVARFFTADNAILWFSGEPPEGLVLDLPRGQAVPAPVGTVVPASLPGHYNGYSDVVAVSMMSDRSRKPCLHLPPQVALTASRWISP